MYKEENLTYEEAKQIIREVIDNGGLHQALWATRLRAGLITVFLMIAAYAISKLSHEPSSLPGLLLIAASLGTSYLLRNVGWRKLAESIHDGSYFDEYTDEDVIKTAAEYARLQNEYEKKKRRKTK